MCDREKGHKFTLFGWGFGWADLKWLLYLSQCGEWLLTACILFLFLFHQLNAAFLTSHVAFSMVCYLAWPQLSKQDIVVHGSH